MSKVKRYGHISYLVEATPQMVQLYPSMTIYTLASDFDAQQTKLAAAEQRNADLIALIGKAHTWVDRNNCGGWDAYELRDELAAALSTASPATINQQGEEV